MYWDGFCAFLPDISGLWGGGGGPNPARISKFGGGGGVFLLEVQYSILKSLISTCVLSYVGSKERIGYLTESASLKRTAGIV